MWLGIVAGKPVLWFIDHLAFVYGWRGFAHPPMHRRYVMNARRKLLKIIVGACSLASLFVLSSIHAGGLLGDLINVVAPGVGTNLDDLHREVKDKVPIYKNIEEGASKTVNEAYVQEGAPLLQELIARSRDDALRAGVQPVPPDIRRNLAGFIPEQVLNLARYRVQGGGDLTLQVSSIRYGEAQAITLDYVIVFKEINDALYNPTLWAHELTHVGQYQSWGIRDFSIRYLRNYEGVEGEAYEAETRYVAWVGLKNTQQVVSVGDPVSAEIVNRPVSSFSLNVSSSTCGTAVSACQVNGSAPVGTPCWCNTPLGAATGSLIPNIVAANQPQPIQPTYPRSHPVGMPSGYGMQICGCWGFNPAPTLPESRCASGAVRVNVCPGYCSGGGNPYAYVCQ